MLLSFAHCKLSVFCDCSSEGQETGGNYLKSGLMASDTESHCFWIALWLRTPFSFGTLPIPTCYRKAPSTLAATQHHNSLKTWLLHSPKTSLLPSVCLSKTSSHKTVSRKTSHDTTVSPKKPEISTSEIHLSFPPNAGSKGVCHHHQACMGVCLHAYLCITYMPTVCRVQKRVSDPGTGVMGYGWL